LLKKQVEIYKSQMTMDVVNLDHIENAFYKFYNLKK